MLMFVIFYRSIWNWKETKGYAVKNFYALTLTKCPFYTEARVFNFVH